ncbi:MAG: hypothetical protein M4579_001614 [Chaenotheca gracillima]|nr:MAG: hypothetical protein M4579_001614 [Chaenotheca gracillima]
MSSSEPLRVGFVPEHFSTPLHFAKKYYSASATLIPFPSGTGHMVTALKEGEIDIGIGLTEGWVAKLGKAGVEESGFRLVGTYVESPLCWAINTSTTRQNLKSVSDLRGSKVGVSRLGSGSHIMSSVLADTQGWLDPSSPSKLTPVPLQTFSNLRAAVNHTSVHAESVADFFMWEYFTSKKYYPQVGKSSRTYESAAIVPPIKKIGEIYTPWPSWQIVASTALTSSSSDTSGKLDERIVALLKSINQGVEYFNSHHDEAVEYISTELDYSAEDAREWLTAGPAGGVKFADDVAAGVSKRMVEDVVKVLTKAGVLDQGKGEGGDIEGIIAVLREGT